MAEAKLQTDMQQQQIPLPHRVFNALFELHIQLAGKDTLAQCQKQKGTGEYISGHLFIFLPPSSEPASLMIIFC